MTSTVRKTSALFLIEVFQASRVVGVLWVGRIVASSCNTVLGAFDGVRLDGCIRHTRADRVTLRATLDLASLAENFSYILLVTGSCILDTISVGVDDEFFTSVAEAHPFAGDDLKQSQGESGQGKTDAEGTHH